MSTQVLSNVEIVHHDIRVWTGKKKLEASDLDRVDRDDLPSAEVASLGLKRLIDARHLTVFNTIRHHADRASREVGVRFLGAYAVPQDAIDDLMVRLEELRRQFDAELQSFLAFYDERVEEWANEHPDFKDQILRAKVHRDTLKARFNASFAVYRVIASERDDGASMQAKSADLYDALLEAVADELSDYVKRSRTAACDGFRTVVRQSILDVAQKIRRFSFLDESGGLIAFAMELEQAVAGTGKIQDADYECLKAVIKDLTSAAAVKDRIRELTEKGGVSTRAVHAQPRLPEPAQGCHAKAPLVPSAVEARRDSAQTEAAASPESENEPSPLTEEGAEGEAFTLDSFSDATRRPSLTSLNW